MADTSEIEAEAVEAETPQQPETPEQPPTPEEPETLEAPEKPRGKTSLLTILLVVFNLLAAIAFGLLLFLDLAKRQDWARAVLFRDLAIFGLPMNEKDLGTNPEAGTQPRHYLEPAVVRDAYQRGRGGKAKNKMMGVHENFKIHIRFEDLDLKLLAKYFSECGVSDPVATLEQEVKRLKSRLPADVDGVAQAVADKVKNPGEKRELLKKILYPLCTEGWQAVNIDEKIAKTPDAKLSDLVRESAKRRMYYDILQPMEVFRPSEKVDPPAIDKAAGNPKLKKLLVDRAADLDGVSVEALKNLFLKRCDDVLANADWLDESVQPPLKRDNLEKRRSAALLTAVSQVESPGADRTEPNQPKGAKAPAKVDPDKIDEAEPAKGGEKKGAVRTLAFRKADLRARVVCGLRDFDQACEDFAIVTEIIEQQTIAAIARDQDQFLASHKNAIKSLHQLALLLDRRTKEHLDLKKSAEALETLLVTRGKQEEEIVAKLLEARATTRRLAMELNALQYELFIAQLNLAQGHAYNLYLARRLVEAEKNAKTTGGKGS